MKTQNIFKLKELINKDVQLVELKKTSISQIFYDGKSSAFSYERTENIFNAKIVSVKGDNCSSMISVQSNELFGSDNRNFYGAINWDIKDSNNCPRICSEDFTYEVVLCK